jgi:hypothetical protein
MRKAGTTIAEHQLEPGTFIHLIEVFRDRELFRDKCRRSETCPLFRDSDSDDDACFHRQPRPRHRGRGQSRAHPFWAPARGLQVALSALRGRRWHAGPGERLTQRWISRKIASPTASVGLLHLGLPHLRDHHLLVTAQPRALMNARERALMCAPHPSGLLTAHPGLPLPARPGMPVPALPRGLITPHPRMLVTAHLRDLMTANERRCVWRRAVHQHRLHLRGICSAR